MVNKNDSHFIEIIGVEKHKFPGGATNTGFGHLAAKANSPSNVRNGSKADINGDLEKCLLSGVKRT